MKIYIVRHGITKENKLRIFQGHLPGELSEEGVEQSKKLSEYFKNIDFDLILSSDLKRARDTLSEILKYHKKTPVKYLKSLREKNYGSFSGKPRRRVEESITEKEFESKESLHKRVKKVIKIILKYKKGNILILGHGSVNKYLITSLLNKDNEFRKSLPIMQNANISIIEIKKSIPKLILFNYTNHLKDL